MKKTSSLFYKVSKKTIFNNSNNFLMNTSHSNLRVISTPEFPVPYYQRIRRAPASPEAVTFDLGDLTLHVNNDVVALTKEELSKTAEGLRVIEFVENKMKLKNYATFVSSVNTQASIYADDLVNYMDAAHEENVRILNEVKLSDSFL